MSLDGLDDSLTEEFRIKFTIETRIRTMSQILKGKRFESADH